MPGKSDGLLVGLSMGTTKITMIVAERDPRYPDGVHIIGFGNAPSRGIKKGVIISLRDAQQSVVKAYQDAQSITGISARRLRDTIVAFNAMDVRSVLTHGMVTLGGLDSKPVETSELERAIGIARGKVALRNDTYPLHMIPVRYAIDDNLVEEPLNMSGSRLDIDMQTVSVPVTHVKNVRTCVEKAGLRVKGLILKPLASSLGSVFQEEMSAGCISICIGGGTTGIVLYEGGRASHIMSIPIGGDHITNDLATVLQISLYEAERLKRRVFDPAYSDDMLMRGGVDLNVASDVITARLEELFNDYVREALSEYNLQLFPGGIILSGGVSFIPGLDRMLSEILRMPVRQVNEPVYSMPPGLDNPAYVSSAGILRYISSIERDPYLFMKADEQFKSQINNNDLEAEQENNNIVNENNNNQLENLPPEEEDYPEDDDEYYDDENPRGSFGDFMRELGERFKNLF